jgi:hypothetical protein
MEHGALACQSVKRPNSQPRKVIGLGFNPTFAMVFDGRNPTETLQFLLLTKRSIGDFRKLSMLLNSFAAQIKWLSTSILSASRTERACRPFSLRARLLVVSFP